MGLELRTRLILNDLSAGKGRIAMMTRAGQALSQSQQSLNGEIPDVRDKKVSVLALIVLALQIEIYLYKYSLAGWINQGLSRE